VTASLLLKQIRRETIGINNKKEKARCSSRKLRKSQRRKIYEAKEYIKEQEVKSLRI
jgi:hypothetical protein